MRIPPTIPIQGTWPSNEATFQGSPSLLPTVGVLLGPSLAARTASCPRPRLTNTSHNTHQPPQ